jgi:hypothetical protein
MRIFYKKLKNWLAVVSVACLSGFLLTSCAKTNNQPVTVAPEALLMVIQASPDAPPADFYLGSTLINGAPINYNNQLPYFLANTGSLPVGFYNSGTATKIAADTINLKNQTAYTLFLANSISKPDFILLTDTVVAPPAGDAYVRFVNVSSDSPAVDFAVKGGSVLIANKGYKGYSSFTAVQADISNNFEIRKAGTNTVLTTLGFEPRAGYIYTVWLQGFAAGTGATALSANYIENGYN